MVLRRTSHAVQNCRIVVQWLVLALVVFVLAYITALMETVTIAHFPYYRFKVTISPCVSQHLALVGLFRLPSNTTQPLVPCMNCLATATMLMQTDWLTSADTIVQSRSALGIHFLT